MGKRVDPKHDATQEVSLSQLLPDPPATPKRAPPRGNPQNDASMWIGSVVGSDDFAPAAKKPMAPAGNRNVIWAVLLLIGGVVAGAGAWYFTNRPRSAAPAAQATTSPSPATPAPAPSTPTPAIAAPAAPVAAPAPTAAVAPPTAAAAAAAGAPSMMVDAISSVGAPIKAKVTKKKVAKKKLTTKPAPTKRR